MFTVALIGPDGCGKTTIARRLENSLSTPAKYIYMGVNLESSNLVLPSTWLLLRLKRARGRRPDMSGPPDPTRRPSPPKGILRRAARGTKSWMRMANLLAEEWFRQRIIAWHRRRGRVVILDRDFFADYYAHDVSPPPEQGANPQGANPQGAGKRSLTSRLHGYVLRRFYRRPDLVVFLDAPAEMLFARKGEGTVELLELRRQEYSRLREVVSHFFTVDATRSLDHVTEAVRDVIVDFQRRQIPATTAARC